MTYACFDSLKVDEYLVTEAYPKTDEVFRAAHIAMTFRLREPRSQAPETATEGELLALTVAGPAGIHYLRGLQDDLGEGPTGLRIIVIVGDTGTGKTERCRYVEAAIRDRSYLFGQLGKYGVGGRQSLQAFGDRAGRVDCLRIERGNLSALGAIAIPFSIRSPNEDIERYIVLLSDDIKKSTYHLL